ncbi:hypothetical protein [Rhodococcus sp. ABRD24]|nr:hypothetical protein [Rhodococcus sp. ABRD24]
MGSEHPMVVFFDILLALCVAMTLWFFGYAIYRSVFEESDRR